MSKSFDAQAINEAKTLGISYFGENRVQEARDKVLGGAFEGSTLCMIGHLRSNKASLAARVFDEVHSVDRLKLATVLSKFSLKYRKRELPVYLQANISGEETKHGCKPSEAYNLARHILDLEGLKLVGLMTIAPVSEFPGDSRLHFRNLRLLRDDMLSMGIPAHNLKELSMGMSSDYQLAIEEGATVIRLERHYSAPGHQPGTKSMLRGTPKTENKHKLEGYLWAKRRPKGHINENSQIDSSGYP